MEPYTALGITGQLESKGKVLGRREVCIGNPEAVEERQGLGGPDG